MDAASRQELGALVDAATKAKASRHVANVKQTEDLRALYDHLDNNDSLKCFVATGPVTLHAGVARYRSSLVDWLLARAAHVGAEQTVADLEAYHWQPCEKSCSASGAFGS
jgi:hypothetical protein